mmetsp:Transcript_129635/g.375458  ORF Transcript_129635/g.375458 Transcript_129635/m.375458 type:complete len:326 (-) Transcript_129635:697-1674(-)
MADGGRRLGADGVHLQSPDAQLSSNTSAGERPSGHVEVQREHAAVRQIGVHLQSGDHVSFEAPRLHWLAHAGGQDDAHGGMVLDGQNDLRQLLERAGLHRQAPCGVNPPREELVVRAGCDRNTRRGVVLHGVQPCSVRVLHLGTSFEGAVHPKGGAEHATRIAGQYQPCGRIELQRQDTCWVASLQGTATHQVGTRELPRLDVAIATPAEKRPCGGLVVQRDGSDVRIGHLRESNKRVARDLPCDDRAIPAGANHNAGLAVHAQVADAVGVRVLRRCDQRQRRGHDPPELDREVFARGDNHLRYAVNLRDAATAVRLRFRHDLLG